MTRYSRQERFSGIGLDGQRALRTANVVIVGCGALGSVLAEQIVRAGVARVTIVDRDFVEASNLQRQSLFDEDDAAAGLPKAVAAETHLRRLNSEVEIHGIVADLAADNADELLAGADIVLDGTDNFETRFLVNDVCVREGIPWVYGACVGAYGLAMLVRPGKTPCLRCLLENLPPAGSGPTCDTVGVIAPIVHVIAGLQAAEALKLLAGKEEALRNGLVTVDLWKGTFDVLDLKDRAPSCPACTAGRYEYADVGTTGASAVLCGRDAVQVRPPRGTEIDLTTLADRLRGLGRVTSNPYLVRMEKDDTEMVVFRDGRAIVKGVATTAEARTLYAKYVGS